jgi:splicing factor 3A subunit 1
MPVVRKTKIDHALDSFYSGLGDLASNKKETVEEAQVQPEFIEDASPEVELSKHTFSERKILKNYQKKPLVQRANLDPLQRCKVCQQLVPASEMSQHVRIELMDPKYFTQRKNERERNKNPNNDAQISRHLKEYASRRTDIFGEDEVEIGREVGEDARIAKKREREKLAWDGVSGNVPGGTGPVAPPVSGGTPLTVQEQIAAIHSKKGVAPSPGMAPPVPRGLPPGMPPPPNMGQGILPPPMSMGMPPGLPPGMPPPPHMPPPHAFPQPPMHPPPPPQPPMHPPPPPMAAPLPLHPVGIQRTHPAPAVQEPPAKKLKPEKSYLPAEEFIAKSADKSVRAKVECPSIADKKEGIKLNGQIITVQMSLTDSILMLKEKLEQAVGLKPNKQKLAITDGTILKDQSSFADLNLAGDIQISLKLKERGGKK